MRALSWMLGAITIAAIPLALGCGGGGSMQRAATSAAYRGESEVEADFSTGGGGGGDSGGGGGERYAYGGEESPARYAQAGPTTTRTTTATTPSTPSTPTTTDARDTSGPLLIYTATLTMAVFEVRATQTSLIERARSFGGVLAIQTDDRLVLRVPAERFDEFLAGVGELGDVLHRDIQALDVGEEFRDVAIRIRNLDVTRQRVEALLAQAANVEQALAVQRELERITTELEALRGRQRFLADRVSLSTITFAFQPMPREAIEQPEIFRLPFRWLDALGLPALLEVR